MYWFVRLYLYDCISGCVLVFDSVLICVFVWFCVQCIGGLKLYYKHFGMAFYIHINRGDSNRITGWFYLITFGIYFRGYYADFVCVRVENILKISGVFVVVISHTNNMVHKK